MTTFTLPRPSRSRALIGLLAAAVAHGVILLIVLWQRDRQQSSKPETSVLIELRLLSTPTAPLRTHAVGLRRAPITSPALALPMPQSGAMPALGPPPSTVATSPEPLKLSLPPERSASSPPPRASMLSQMLNDPRTRSLKRTVEWAIADAAGTLPVLIQSSTDGTNSTLIRHGSKCIRVAEARIKTLDPMDDSARGASSVSGACIKD